MHTPFNLYSKQEYLTDVTARIARTSAGDRVALATMTFEPKYSEIRKLIDELGKASARGVVCSLAIDAYVFMIGEDRLFGPLLFHAELPGSLKGEYAEKFQVLQRLREQKVRCVITNQPHRTFSNPVSGRSHIKFTLINDRIYLGGCNLDEPDNIDIMAGWDDVVIADSLHNFASETIEHQGTDFMKGSDTELALDKTTTVYTDSGVKHQSLILNKAIKLIDQAQERLLISCQFFPNSITARHLLAAHKRGVKVTILFNHPSKFSAPKRLPQYANVAYQRRLMSKQFFSHQLDTAKPYLHAKVLASESAVMIGSHNFMKIGVDLGTAEIALAVNDSVFASEVCNKISTLSID